MSLPLLPLLLAMGPCDPIDRVAPDPALASVYAKVAREEERHGAHEASVAAWRMAAQLEPPGGPAEQALRRGCTAFERGQDLFNRRDCPHALPLLRAARGGPDDAEAALLEGICAWELADDAGAIAALGVARGDPQLLPTAELFLGLLSLRQGDSRAALAQMRSAARSDSEALRSTAAQLIRLADRKDRLVVEAAVEGGYDSNALAVAFATVLPGGADDGFVAATAGVTFRPLADSGPFLLVGGGYRKQALFSQSDVGLGTGTLGWEVELGRVRASLDYGLDFVSLGAAPWLLRQRGTVRALAVFGPTILSGEYSLRHEALWAESVKADSGLRHAARLSASLLFANQVLELSAVFTRALGTTADRSSIEAGGELRWLLRPSARVDLEAALGARWRGFDAIDPDLLVMRREVQLDARLGANLALNQNLSLFIALEGRRVSSSVGALTYTRLEASAGLRFSMGVW